MKIGILSIEVLEGKNLVPMDSDGKSDPYCVFIVGDKKKKTKAVRHTLNPKWENESYDFSIDQNLMSIIVEVYDWDRFTSDDRMGMFVIPIEEIMECATETQRWYTLVPIKPEDKVSGDIRIKMKFERTSQLNGTLHHHHSLLHHHHHNSVNNISSSNLNPLIKFIKDGDIQSVEQLMAKSKIDYNLVDQDGTPSIHLGAASNNIPLMMILLKGSDLKITIRDPQGNTPLHILAHKCTNISNGEVILKFIEKGCSVTDVNQLGETPLHKACLSTIHKTLIVDTLISKGSNVNAVNKNGDTPLHYAVKLGRSDFVTIFIQNGANLHLESGKPPKKPLDLAIESGNQSIVNKIKQAIEITEWLSNLQLDSLIDTFLQNELYLDVVPDIDESVLDRLQITIFGQRAKLLKAVKKLQEVPVIVSSPPEISSSTTTPIINPQSSNDQILPSSPKQINPNQNNNQGNQQQLDNVKNEQISQVIPTPTSPLSPSTPNNNNNNNNTDFNNLGNKDDIPAASAGGIAVNADELSQLRHVHSDSSLDTTTWIIDENNLKYGPLLGTGASGKVYKGFYNEQEVAIKVLKSSSNPKDILEFKKEFQIVSSLRAPGVVYFHGAGFRDRLCIVMEYCSRGSLYHILKDESWLFTWDMFFKIAEETISSLNSLHEWTPQVLHRDLKSLNFLVTENWTVKICDFGLSRFDTGSNLETLGKLRGTYAYVAPEVYFGSKYTTKSDIYSMGMILWEMLYRCVNGLYQFPYQEYPHLKFDYQILISAAKKEVRPTFPANSPNSLVQLIKRSLLKDSIQRPSAVEFLEELARIKQEYESNRSEWDCKRSTPFHPNSKNDTKNIEQDPNPNPNNENSENNNSDNNNNVNVTNSSTVTNFSMTPPLNSITPSTTESIKSPTNNLKETILTRNRSSSSPINPNFFVKPTEGELRNLK